LRIDPGPQLKAYSFWVGDVPYPLLLKSSEPEGNIIHPKCTTKFDAFSVERHTTTKDKKEVAFNLTVDFVGRPKILVENPEMPKFKMAGFRPELIDNKNMNLGYKEYSITVRLSAEGVLPIEKKFSLLFSLDLSQDAVQI